MCGVMAVYSRANDAAALTQRGLLALQHRGQEAAGLVSMDANGAVHALRGRGLVNVVVPENLAAALPGERAVGHVRYSTVPCDRAENVQPFLAETPYGELALCHNGNLKNAAALKDDLSRSGTTLTTSMDSELLAHLIARSSAKDLLAAVRQALAQGIGAYALTILCEKTLLGVRDPLGLRPLWIGELAQQRGYVLASESCALLAIGATPLRELAPGEIVTIGPDGVRSEALFVKPLSLPVVTPSPCVFELVYFARPDSRIFDRSVYAARLKMGEELARQDNGTARPAELVVPVPHSGVAAAEGYARQSGLPLVHAIRCDDDIGRTFILPDDSARAEGTRLKLSVIRDEVIGKRVVLVDDSLVRGHTARAIVRKVREAGATEVGLRIASPPIAWPCYLGIDMPSREELLINQVTANTGSAEESKDAAVHAVARLIGVDSLRYLDREGLRRAVGSDHFCHACMDGRYPI